MNFSLTIIDQNGAPIERRKYWSANEMCEAVILAEAYYISISKPVFCDLRIKGIKFMRIFLHENYQIYE